MLPANWTDQLLQDLGAPNTKKNRVFLILWQMAEGNPGPRNNNPLNIKADSAPKDRYGVSVYPDWNNGAKATARFLMTNSYYTAIVSALKSGDPWGNPSRLNQIADAFRHWAGVKPGGNLTDAYRRIIQFGSEGNAADWTSVDITNVPVVGGPAKSAGHAVGTAVDAGVNAAKDTVGAITSVGDAIKWAFANWDRILEVLGGFVLLMLGLYRLAGSTGVPTPGRLPAGAAA